MIEKLLKREFFDVYAISLILKDVTDLKTLQYLAYILNPIAEKYFAISEYAVKAELRYFRRGAHSVDSDVIEDENVELLKELGIKNWRTGRKKLTLNDAYFLLKNGIWESNYGGEAWADICTATMQLKSLLPVTAQNIKQVIKHIDRLNDLEHNNALYLAQYCTFYFKDALDYKHHCDPDELMLRCSPDIKDIWKEKGIPHEQIF